MHFSYWEKTEWLGPIDYLIVGGGITGMATAVFLRELQPKKQVAVIEAGMLPYGASTRNAGFACFGSAAEVRSDIKAFGESAVYQLMERRLRGLRLLEQMLGPRQLDLQFCGGYDLFRPAEKEQFEAVKDELAALNELFYPLFRAPVFKSYPREFPFKNVAGLIRNEFEGQLNPGRMMQAFRKKAELLGVKLFYGAALDSWSEGSKSLTAYLKNGAELTCEKLLLCTNAFTAKLIDRPVRAVRNQVLITKPHPAVNWRGCFHLEEGHLYFRNVGQRVLIGGGRQHFGEAEETSEMETSAPVQSFLENQLRELIFPDGEFEIEQRWSGLLGLGEAKTPVLEQYSDRVYLAARLGGMGVALGSALGQDLAKLASP